MLFCRRFNWRQRCRWISTIIPLWMTACQSSGIYDDIWLQSKLHITFAILALLIFTGYNWIIKTPFFAFTKTVFYSLNYSPMTLLSIFSYYFEIKLKNWNKNAAIFFKISPRNGTRFSEIRWIIIEILRTCGNS